MGVLRRWPLERRVLMLHSGRFNERWARYSIITQPAGVYRFAADAGMVSVERGRRRRGAIDTGAWMSQWLGHGAKCPVEEFSHNPFRDLRALLTATGGLWIGYLSYDLGRWVEPRLRGISGRDDWPVIELGYCPGYLVHDGLTGRWWACGDWRGEPPKLNSDELNAPEVSGLELESNFSRAGYLAAVACAKRAIAAGEVYQVNLAQRFTSKIHVASGGGVGDAAAGSGLFPGLFPGVLPGVGRGLYQQLAEVSPAWFGAYLELSCDGDGCNAKAGEPSRWGGRAVVSASPELFLRVEGREVVTRPIKGTRPASASPAELRDSVKDQAELNMIVDLMRNDLGRVCAYGSVEVQEARTIESHPTVHHGAATVAGRLHESKDVVDLLRATMPGGSVTGAPKIRAMELIDELEPDGRGPYCGCIGYLSRERSCLSVAIRTALMDIPGGRLDFSVGSGIVADSDPEGEYQETLDKASAIVRAVSVAESAVRGG